MPNAIALILPISAGDATLLAETIQIPVLPRQWATVDAFSSIADILTGWIMRNEVGPYRRRGERR